MPAWAAAPQDTWKEHIHGGTVEFWKFTTSKLVVMAYECNGVAMLGVFNLVGTSFDYAAIAKALPALSPRGTFMVPKVKCLASEYNVMSFTYDLTAPRTHWTISHVSPACVYV